MPRHNGLQVLRCRILSTYVPLLIACCQLGTAAAWQDAPDKSQGPPGPLPIEARLLIPLTGSKTTFRFEVTNIGKHTGVFPPFVNSTQLSITTPDGKTGEWSCCQENAEPDVLQKGETKSWDVDVADHIKFKQKGKYVLALVVGQVRSNEVILVVDEVPPPAGADPAARLKERAEALLVILRAKQWDKAAPYVIVATGKPAPLTRLRMEIADDASREEASAKVAAWFRSLYERGAEVGELQAVKINARDKTLALVNYIHEDLDGFSMRQVDGEWYYTLDDMP